MCGRGRGGLCAKGGVEVGVVWKMGFSVVEGGGGEEM